jgi:hypothetical protein
MKVSWAALVLLLMAGVCSAAEPTVTLAWDAVVNDKLTGYHLYYGKQSRYDPSLDAAAILKTAQEKWCGKLPTEGEVPESMQTCWDSWANYCKAPDLLCDVDYFPYDGVVEVDKAATEYTLTLPGPGKYFLAIAARNDNTNPVADESQFSIELTHDTEVEKPSGPPGEPKKFHWKEVVDGSGTKNQVP